LFDNVKCFNSFNRLKDFGRVLRQLWLRLNTIKLFNSPVDLFNMLLVLQREGILKVERGKRGERGEENQSPQATKIKSYKTSQEIEDLLKSMVGFATSCDLGSGRSGSSNSLIFTSFMLLRFEKGSKVENLVQGKTL